MFSISRMKKTVLLVVLIVLVGCNERADYSNEISENEVLTQTPNCYGLQDYEYIKTHDSRGNNLYYKNIETSYGVLTLEIRAKVDLQEYLCSLPTIYPPTFGNNVEIIVDNIGSELKFYLYTDLDNYEVVEYSLIEEEISSYASEDFEKYIDEIMEIYKNELLYINRNRIDTISNSYKPDHYTITNFIKSKMFLLDSEYGPNYNGVMYYDYIFNTFMLSNDYNFNKSISSFIKEDGENIFHASQHKLILETTNYLVQKQGEEYTIYHKDSKELVTVKSSDEKTEIYESLISIYSKEVEELFDGGSF